MNEYTHIEDTRITRRGSLVKLGGLLATALVGAGWKADSSLGAGPAGVASGAVACVLTPELTEGPYYIANEKVRSNITEGKPGTPLTLRLTVLDASTCKAVTGAAVDIWHCDAAGVYSGYGSGGSGGPGPGGGQHAQPTNKLAFLRGIQQTDARGITTFQTIYPGWYPGRAVHIHVKVHLGGKVVHTGQLFFPDTLTDAVYAKAPYSKRRGRDTRNAGDSIYRNGGSKGMLTLHRNGARGYVGTIAMGVHTS